MIEKFNLNCMLINSVITGKMIKYYIMFMLNYNCNKIKI